MEQYKDRVCKACGFVEPRIIDDFPIRSRLVSLRVRGRRWEGETDKGTIKISRDWDTIISQGARLTAEFAAFLKVFGHYQGQ